MLDDFAACKIARKQDWVDLYAKPYYFGCEADDRMNVTAFGKANPFGARINAIFSSDIGHFDVPDMLSPVPEAYELVEDELITSDDFRDFTFANAVRLWGQQNPRFFEGTVVAKEAAAVLNVRSRQRCASSRSSLAEGRGQGTRVSCPSPDREAAPEGGHAPYCSSVSPLALSQACGGSIGPSHSAAGQRPEARAVVEVHEMGDLVRHQVVQHLGRREDQAPGERQAAVGPAASPARAAVAQR